jgi:hypothetical protein
MRLTVIASGLELSVRGSGGVHDESSATQGEHFELTT